MSTITIQLGGFSNFVGTHRWNCQDSIFSNGAGNGNAEIEQDTFFQHGGHKLGKPSHFPRLVAVDLKGCAEPHLLTESKMLGENGTGDALWSEIDIQSASNESDLDGNLHSRKGKMTSTEQSDTQQELEDTNLMWKNFKKFALHRKSLCLLPDYEHSDHTEPFDTFTSGVLCWKKEESQEMMEDSVRSFAEECDYIEGFHVLMDGDNGFGGLGKSFLEFLNEEYERKPIFAFPLFPTVPSEKVEKTVQLTNIGLLLPSLFENCALFSPMSLNASWISSDSRHIKHLNYKPCSSYETSALLATALDTVMLPLQAKGENKLTMNCMSQWLTNYGRKAVGVSCAIPLTDRDHSKESRKELGFPQTFMSMTPCIDNYQGSWSQVLVCRGVEKAPEYFFKDLKLEQTPSINTYFRSLFPGDSPYSNLLSNIPESHRPRQSKGFTRFPVYGGLHSSSAIGSSLRQLHTAISAIHVKSLHRFNVQGMEEDDILQSRTQLLDFVDLYLES